MELVDCFNFEDGRKVIVGYVYGCEHLIRNCICDLFKNDEFIQKIHITTEQIVRKKIKNEYRALETIEDLPFTHENIKDNKWEIIFNQECTK
ncbi:hypothetical protein J3893_001522 [Salmonella enterica subsp. enterica serovar Nigeria]|nr:hypothetical protein [Salmonella enterica subsp. enterica serovar Nigeria]